MSDNIRENICKYKKSPKKKSFGLSVNFIKTIQLFVRMILE